MVIYGSDQEEKQSMSTTLYANSTNIEVNWMLRRFRYLHTKQ